MPLFLLALALPLQAQKNPIESAIRGAIVDETTGQRIPQAMVELMDGKTRLRASAFTDASGSFVLSNVPTGPFRLRVTRIGYAKTITPYWRVQAGELLTVTVRLHPEAVLLAPLEITARSRSGSPVLEGFYDRLERRMGGVFFTREDIENRNPVRVTDLLSAVPGVELQNAPGYGRDARVVRFSRSLLGTAGGVCPVQVFVDGVLASRRAEVPLDHLATPNGLEAMEVYRGTSTIPPEFLTADARCGVIALWTRRGG